MSNGLFISLFSLCRVNMDGVSANGVVGGNGGGGAANGGNANSGSAAGGGGGGGGGNGNGNSSGGGGNGGGGGHHHHHGGHHGHHNGEAGSQNGSSGSGRSTPSSDCSPGKLFVGGLSWQTTPEKLREYFGQFGSVTDVLVMKDPVTQVRRMKKASILGMGQN